jgi:hypothetical protein
MKLRCAIGGKQKIYIIYNMSATLNFSPLKYLSWKGKTFSQIVANIRSNKNNLPKSTITSTAMQTRIIMNQQPLKIYRKEIASMPLKTCNRRTSVKISDLVDIPGGTIVNSKVSDNSLTNGLVNIVDPNFTTITGQYSGSSCNTILQNPSGLNGLIPLSNRCLSNQNNALRRVRSAGMITRKFVANNNNDTYYTTAGQRLNHRGKSFAQKSFNMLRQGNNQSKPGTAASLNNVYGPNILSDCSGSAIVPVYFKPSNSKFSKQGGVSSSTRILRLKYDTITNAGYNLQKQFGKATANAHIYKTSNTDSNKVSSKTKTGYTNMLTPFIMPYTGRLLQRCPWANKKPSYGG